MPQRSLSHPQGSPPLRCVQRARLAHCGPRDIAVERPERSPGQLGVLGTYLETDGYTTEEEKMRRGGKRRTTEKKEGTKP
jgi:hypothetical protein